MNRRAVTSDKHQAAIDPVVVSMVVREVVGRLKARSEARPDAWHGDSKCDTSTSMQHCADQVVSLESLRNMKPGAVRLPSSAVVTPAAREEAARRGIRFSAGDENDAESCDFQRQLARRGISLRSHIAVVWTEDPATEVYKRCVSGRRAVMVTCLEDVARFAQSFDPQVWVLDRHKFTLATAVHAAGMISKLPTGDSE
ncbi:MAG: hypothetical protein AAF802_16015 [Planctomycetota bacterium]